MLEKKEIDLRVGSNIKRERIRAGYTQEKFSELIGIGTKSQQALKLQQEEGKLERKIKSREQREAEKEFQFELKQQKKKEKHRGR